jgi:hypothetical protein
MKCFKRLVMAHFNTIIPDILDPVQFVYRLNRSTDHAIFIASQDPGTEHLPLQLDLFTDNHETAYIEEVRYLTVWCQDNNLSINWIGSLTTMRQPI